MSSGYQDLETALPKEHHKTLKVLWQLPESIPMKSVTKLEVTNEELEPCASTLPVQETINLGIHTMIQLLVEDSFLLCLAIGQKFVMGEEGLSHTSLANTYKIP